ncbi:MBL fold metallo-hydrolase [Williamsia deligens]|uniref:MBL fold metallo-hydrolase n=1 Tax=Williamsia deligens TaxID=321325 RepID=A0ABW3G930_9NOCA|nr:MBL fold metallo-hydrolase [Williamsia deligens]MCP2195950.1 Glyoxylase, beta-lactamase superfamily II [Williamsia deligens]
MTTRWERDAAPGIHRLEHAHTNLYLVETDGGLLLVDTGLPRSYGPLLDAIADLGRTPRDLSAIVLTHGHFDHVGTARRLASQWDLPVLAPELDRRLVAHPYRYAHQDTRVGAPLRHPRSWPLLAGMVGAGALTVRGVPSRLVTTLDATTPLPGGAVLVPTPGHTAGHVALHLPDRDAVISGDALVTLDPYTGATGPRIVAGAATADIDRTRASLGALEQTGAQVVLPGHGSPWRDGVAAAVDLARTTSG